MYLIVGLGNPGKKFEKNRHNFGFRTIDELARLHSIDVSQMQKKALVGSGSIAGKKVLLAKPQTYMNLSGEAVRGLLDFYKLEVPNLLVISDDLDIPLGTVRLRQSGGAGGQKGLKSITQHIGTQEFSRVRLGIGRPPGRMDPADWVLNDFKGDDAILAAEVVDRAVLAVESWLTEGIERAMTRFNGSVEQPIKPTKQPQKEQE